MPFSRCIATSFICGFKIRKPKDHRVYFGEEKADIPPIRSLDGLSEELQDLINRKHLGYPK